MQLASCTFSLQGLTRLRKYYQLEVQLASFTTSWQGLRRLENTTGQRYGLHSQLTLPNIYYSLLHILLFCTPNQSCTSLNHFFHEFVYIQLFLFGLVPLPLPLRELRKYYWLEVQLPHFVDFTQLLLWFVPHFTFLHSKLQSYMPWNQFFFCKLY